MSNQHMDMTHTSVTKQYGVLAAAFGLSFVAAYGLETARSVGGLVFLHEAMNAFMGFVYIVFALPKLFDLQGFSESFAAYDIIGSQSKKYARAYPFIELAIGLVLLSNWPTHSVVANQVVSVLIVLLSGVAIAGVVRSLRKGETHHCACLGSFFQFPLSKLTVIENSVMFAMAASMLLFYGSIHLIVISLSQARMFH